MTSNGHFERPVWTKAVSAVSAVTTQEIDRANLDTRWRTQMKDVWRSWIAHTGSSKGNLSGWTFDRAKGTYTSSKDVMARQFAKYPKFKRFREAGPRYREQMEELLGSRVASGKFARGNDILDAPARPSDDESALSATSAAAPQESSVEATAGSGEKERQLSLGQRRAKGRKRPLKRTHCWR